jgi:hypothetical protein
MIFPLFKIQVRALLSASMPLAAIHAIETSLIVAIQQRTYKHSLMLQHLAAQFSGRYPKQKNQKAT